MKKILNCWIVILVGMFLSGISYAGFSSGTSDGITIGLNMPTGQWYIDGGKRAVTAKINISIDDPVGGSPMRIDLKDKNKTIETLYKTVDYGGSYNYECKFVPSTKKQMIYAEVSIDISGGSRNMPFPIGKAFKKEASTKNNYLSIQGTNEKTSEDIEKERQARLEKERQARLEQQRKAKEEADRKAMLERQSKQREEDARQAQLDKEREEAERQDRIEKEKEQRKEAELQAWRKKQREKREAEREAQRKAQVERERQAGEEQARQARQAQLEKERKEKEAAESMRRAKARAAEKYQARKRAEQEKTDRRNERISIGCSIRDISSKELYERFGVHGGAGNYVIVTSISSNTPASRGGLVVGTIVGNQTASSFPSTGKRGDSFNLYIPWSKRISSISIQFMDYDFE